MNTIQNYGMMNYQTNFQAKGWPTKNRGHRAGKTPLQLLEKYVKEHPKDTSAQQKLSLLKATKAGKIPESRLGKYDKKCPDENILKLLRSIEKDPAFPIFGPEWPRRIPE